MDPGPRSQRGDIVCNSISTALGVALVLSRRNGSRTAPRRSAWQALATAVAAVLVWIGTGAMLRQSFPPPPYHTAKRTRAQLLGPVSGQVLWSSFAIGALSVRATAPSRPQAAPHRSRGARPAQRRAVHPRDGRPRSFAELPHAGDPLWTLGAPTCAGAAPSPTLRPATPYTAATSSDGKQICWD